MLRASVLLPWGLGCRASWYRDFLGAPALVMKEGVLSINTTPSCLQDCVCVCVCMCVFMSVLDNGHYGALAHVCVYV